MDLSLLLPVFSLIFTVVSKLLLLYNTIDKISGLKMKSFSTVRDTQRGSQSYIEKRRGRRELEVTRMRLGGIKRGESKLARNHFLMCTPQLDHSEGGRRQRWPGGLKGEMRRRETDPASNQFPKCSPPSETHRNSRSWVEQRWVREETQLTWWRKRIVQRGREQSSH